MKNRTVVSLTALALVACGRGGERRGDGSSADAGADSLVEAGSSADAGAEGGQVTPFDDPTAAASELCEEHARLSCEREVACGLLQEGERRADCELRQVEQCIGGPALGYLYPFALVGIRFRYTPALAEDCTQPPRDCVQRHRQPDCFLRFEGVAEANSSCTQWYQNECQAGHHCALNAFCEGGCLPDVGLGGACERRPGDRAEPCAEGLRCIEGACVEAPAEGEPCSPVRCAEGLRCGENDRCEREPASPGMGESCLEYECEDGGMACPPTAHSCEEGLVCSHGLCTDEPREADAGESCKTWSDCKSGLRCVGVMDGERECREPAADGSACAEKLECREGSTCAEGECQKVVPLALGEACDRSFRCIDGTGDPGCCELGARCDDNVCVADWLQQETPLGEACDVDRDNCELFSYCDPDSEVCEPAKFPGDACTFDEECAWNGFGRCGEESGRCEEYPDTCRDREFLE